MNSKPEASRTEAQSQRRDEQSDEILELTLAQMAEVGGGWNRLTFEAVRIHF